MQTGYEKQPAPEPTRLAEMVSANEATASDLKAVNQVVHEAIKSWGLPERVRRLAKPSLSYNQSDLPHMSIILLSSNPERKGVAVAAWEEATRIDTPENSRGVLIHGLYVVPEYQHLGLGTRLIDLLANRIAVHNIDGMAVRAWRDSLGFFLSRNFTPLNGETDSDTYPRRLWRVLT